MRNRCENAYVEGAENERPDDRTDGAAKVHELQHPSGGVHEGGRWSADASHLLPHRGRRYDRISIYMTYFPRHDDKERAEPGTAEGGQRG